MSLLFEKLINDDEKIAEMSHLAKTIVKEVFDPLIGSAQNDYMINLFQTEDAIKGQLEHGYEYYFALQGGEKVGFTAFYERNGGLYLSKFYLEKSSRGKGLSHELLDFVVMNCKAKGLPFIELNVNRGNPAVLAYKAMGFIIAREEKNDIGSGFFMDDYVMRLEV